MEIGVDVRIPLTREDESANGIASVPDLSISANINPRAMVKMAEVTSPYFDTGIPKLLFTEWPLRGSESIGFGRFLQSGPVIVKTKQRSGTVN